MLQYLFLVLSLTVICIKKTSFTVCDCCCCYVCYVQVVLEKTKLKFLTFVFTDIIIYTPGNIKIVSDSNAHTHPSYSMKQYLNTYITNALYTIYFQNFSPNNTHESFNYKMLETQTVTDFRLQRKLLNRTNLI